MLRVWWYTFVIPALWRSWQEDHEFEVSLGDVARPHLKKSRTKTKSNNFNCGNIHNKVYHLNHFEKFREVALVTVLCSQLFFLTLFLTEFGVIHFYCSSASVHPINFDIFVLCCTFLSFIWVQAGLISLYIDYFISL
jgi:hypothetical protein